MAVEAGDNSLEMTFKQAMFDSHRPADCSIDVNFGDTDSKGIFSTMNPPAGYSEKIDVSPDGDFHLHFKGAIRFNTLLIKISDGSQGAKPFTTERLSLSEG